MRSLKAILIAWTTIGAATILVAAGIVLYVLVRARLAVTCAWGLPTGCGG